MNEEDRRYAAALPKGLVDNAMAGFDEVAGDVVATAVARTVPYLLGMMAQEVKRPGNDPMTPDEIGHWIKTWDQRHRRPVEEILYDRLCDAWARSHATLEGMVAIFCRTVAEFVKELGGDEARLALMGLDSSDSLGDGLDLVETVLMATADQINKKPQA